MCSKQVWTRRSKKTSLFWEELDEVVRDIQCIEKLFLGGDFNGHIGTTFRGYDDVHDGFNFGDRNEDFHF